jgi:hypothetical protein
MKFRRWDSSVGIAVSYEQNGWGSIPGRGKHFLFFKATRLTLGLTQPPIQWVSRVISLGVKQLGREAEHSSSAEVKNGGVVPPLPCMFSWHNT